MNTVTRLERLRDREHTATVDVVEALLELNESGEYLALGHSTIWDFLVHHLKYSNAAASRRYKAMKCAARFPQVLTMLREHRTTLSALAQAEATLAKVKNPEQLLSEIDGRPAREVERAVARRNPAKARRESVRRKFVRKEKAAVPSDQGLFDEAASAVEDAGPAPVDTLERVLISFSLSPEDFADFERVKAILSRKHPQGLSVELAFQELMAFFLKNKAPKPRCKAEKSRKQPAGRPAAKPAKSTTKSTSPRYVPKRLRDEIHRRDGGRCTYRGRNGRRCKATHNLQVDHIQPVAAGGRATLDNLRLLCAQHNRWRTRDLVPTRKSAAREEILREPRPVDRCVRRDRPRTRRRSQPRSHALTK